MTANSNTLMKKTKAQLVEIILKNDEVVLNMKKDMDGTIKTLDDFHDKNKKLNDELSNANNEIKHLKEEIKDLSEDYDAQVELCEQFKEEIDNNVTLLAEYENKVSKLKSEKCNKKAIRCWQFATIAAIVLAIIFAIV